MERFQAIFIDDGGVLNDNELREPQWRELDAQFYAPRYGGDHDAWKEASGFAFEEVLRVWKEAMEDPEIDYFTYWKKATEHQMAKLFELMGIPLPALQEQYKVAREADEWISCRLKSAFPGAIETVHSLKEQGYLLYTASGGASWQIRGFLTGMGIVDCFEELYGADLVNTMKSNPLFYKRIFEQTGIQANRAIIVDDHLANIERATVVGATAVLVSPSGKTRNENGILSIPRLDGLPQLLSEVLQE